MRYQIRHALVQYAADTILEDVNFEIHDKEKIAVVGRNGCGKTTLLKLIAGDLEMSNLDSDESCGINMAGKQQIGFLRQISFEDGNVTVEEEIKKSFAPVFACEARMKELEEQLHRTGQPQGQAYEAGSAEKHEQPGQETLLREYARLQNQMEALRGYTWQQDMEIMFQKFGFPLEDLKRPIGSYSGGQQTKVAFIKLLLSRPDIMLLDEPTNHLDLPTIEWLENYLREYDKAVVIVSHDRMFLDRVIDVTYEIEYHRIKRYPGNYSAFIRQKEENLAKQEKDYEEQQKEIERLTAWIEKWKNMPTKVAATRSKRMAIEHMVKIEKPRRFDTRTFHAMFTPRIESYTDVLTVKNLKIGYDRELSQLSFQLKKGERLAIIGENGKGKSTLLKTLVGEIPALGGSFTLGPNVEWGYFDQQKAVVNDADPEQTVLENFWEEYPKLMREDVRSALGSFLFSQEDVEKKMGQLSGGEKVRLALCKMFQTKPNLLILDEPTNHMDMIGKDALEQMLSSFPGTVLFVSHDRYFIRQIATEILEFQASGVRQYPCGYEDYLQEKNRVTTAPGAAAQKKSKAPEPTLEDVFDKKTYYNPGKIKSRLTRQLEKYETMLAESEQKAAELQMQLLDPALATDYQKLMELQQQLEAEEHQQESLLERMLETETELEQISG
ncbi:MAG: ABC-F family ATP-binding cassette domain-containing protein [Roseburia sp.]|nr:ABC-F family ATP-binding cassette domain-containing protein [Roseburia sp.]